MKYFGNHSDISNQSEKVGVLIANLGTPDAPKCPKLRNYLSQFLTDPRVIELPLLLRQFLVRGIIINVRAHKSAAAYRTVWTEEGSPLMNHSVQFCNKLKTSLGDNYSVELGMRYGKPSIDTAIKNLLKKGIRKMIVLPMYPQYSGTTSGSIMDAIANSLKKVRWVPSLHFINSYFDHDQYIQSISDSVRQHWGINGRAEKLIFSFHGIPQRYVKNGDPYQFHCEQTVSLVAKNLGINSDDYLLVYQSRVGREPWLQPYCDETMKNLPNLGVKSIDIICPGFSADCLETIEEIEEENKDYFLTAGGEKFNYIECLNSHDSHIQMAKQLILKTSKTF